MHNGRRYPTLVTLGSGRTLAFAGFGTNGENNQQPEIFSFAFAGGWSAFPPTSSFPTYPHLVLLADGRLFFSGMCVGGTGLAPRTLALPQQFTQPILEQAISGLPDPLSNDQGATVLLPPAQAQQVMVLGGGSSRLASSRVATIDFTATSPAYVAAPSMQYARMHLSAVLLPDGSVLTFGGNPNRGVDELRLEVYQPSYMSLPRPASNRSLAPPGFYLLFVTDTGGAPSTGRWMYLS
jgi:hypothetical protein